MNRERIAAWVASIILLMGCQQEAPEITYDFRQGVITKGGKHYKFAQTANGDMGCYSSNDLQVWEREGTALKSEIEAVSPIAYGCTMSSPSVLYNAHSKQFVMWFQLEINNQADWAAYAAVAVSKQIEGPYQFVRAGRVNPMKYPAEMTTNERITLDTLQWKNYHSKGSKEWNNAVKKGLLVKRDLPGGQMAGEMSLFVDMDGKGYHIYVSEEGWALHLAELTDDYLSHTGKYIRIAVGQQHGSPYLSKGTKSYQLISLQDTLTSPTIWGPWDKTM